MWVCGPINHDVSYMLTYICLPLLGKLCRHSSRGAAKKAQCRIGGETQLSCTGHVSVLWVRGDVCFPPLPSFKLLFDRGQNEPWSHHH